MSALTSEEVMNKHPQIFQEKDLDMRHTCMCWGLEVADTWLPVIDQACTDIDKLCTGGLQLVAEQVKQKWGELRFYYRIEDDGDEANGPACEAIVARIEGLEHACNSTCEWCGKPGEARGPGWIRVSCDVCQMKRYGKEVGE